MTTKTRSQPLRERVAELEQELESARDSACEDTDPRDLGVAARRALAEHLPAFAALDWMAQDKVTDAVVEAVMRAHRRERS